MNAFLQAYVVAALWSTNDNADESGGEPLDKNYSHHDIAQETMTQMAADCEKFISENEKWLTPEHCLKPSYEQGSLRDPVMARAGHDFWLTRNRHGCGFWDGDWSEEAGKALTDAAHKFGEVNLEVGDDKKIYSL
jgi:hypothetical protein